MLGNYSWFCCLRTLKKQNFHEHYQSVQQFGPRSGPTHFVVPDLGPSCFQRLSADEKARKQGNSFFAFIASTYISLKKICLKL